MKPVTYNGEMMKSAWQAMGCPDDLGVWCDKCDRHIWVGLEQDTDFDLFSETIQDPDWHRGRHLRHKRAPTVVHDSILTGAA